MTTRKSKNGKAMPSLAKSYNSSDGTGDSNIWSEDGDGPRVSFAVGMWEGLEEPDLPPKVSSEDEEIWFIDVDDDDDEDHDAHSNAAVQTRRTIPSSRTNGSTSDKIPRNVPSVTATSTSSGFNLVLLKEREITEWENQQNVNPSARHG
jgi:hypothetical protein